jgi:CheY-like chemotaxis protein
VMVEPGMIWSESLKLLKSTLPANISIRQNLPKGKWRGLADPTELHQILVNLCANAAHAMRESGGDLSITLDQVGFDGVSVPVGLEPGDYMRLNVGDTGHGIEQAFLERIFEPYYSTKPLGEGTGLGLAVVHGLVEAHGGAITVVSQAGQGTTFTVFLPLAQTQAAAPAPSEQQALPRGVGRLMLVDDEPELLAMQSKSLERLGYRVSAYENAALAWRAFREDPQGFDLVVTDQATPEMTGLQLADRIRSLPSGAPIILCTGFLERRLDEEISRVGIREVLIKPFSRSHLALAVQRALAPRPADRIN